MENLQIIGLILTPFLLVAVFIRPEIILYYIVLDSWLILRISQVTFFHPSLSLNRLLVFISFLIIFLNRVIKRKTLVPNSGRNLLSFIVAIFVLYCSYSYYSYTGELNFNLINNMVFYYLSLLLLEEDFANRFNRVVLVVLFPVLLLAGSMICNNIMHSDVGQLSFAGNRTHSAFYILVGMTLLFAFREKIVKHPLVKQIINFIITCGSIAIMLSLGRAIIIVFIITIFFYVLKGYIKPLTVVLSGVLMVLLAVSQYDALLLYKDKLLRIPESKHHSIKQFNKDEMAALTSGRTPAYEAAWKLYLKAPITGIGYDRWASDIMKGQKGSSLHSRWLQIVLETGIPGFSLYAALYAISFFYLFCMNRNSKTNSLHDPPIEDALFVAISAFLLMGITDNHGFTDRIFYLFLAMISIQYSIAQKKIENSTELSTRTA